MEPRPALSCYLQASNSWSSNLSLQRTGTEARCLAPFGGSVQHKVLGLTSEYREVCEGESGISSRDPADVDDLGTLRGNVELRLRKAGMVTRVWH